MLNFCTLFDSNYISRGIAMYESLIQHHAEFRLFVYAFDDLTYTILESLKLEKVTLVSLKEFEDLELLKVKNSRSKGEYCWTCTPSIILHSIQKFKLDHSIYVDADLYFFDNTKVLIDEIGNNSILITRHNYTPKYDQTKTSGIYCVQFMYFKNDECGMTALNWWREKCIEWCYARYEDGRFGDQKYLDDWASRFKNVHVLENTGGGIAPWNVQQYEAPISNIIFYHYHGFKYNPQGLVNLGDYTLSNEIINQLYIPYLSKIIEIEAYLTKLFPSYSKEPEVPKLSVLRKIKKILKNNYNYYEIDQILPS